MAVPVFVLNGPNLNLLGQREPAVYGKATLAEIERHCHEAGKRLGLSVDFRQTNHEGMLIDWVQEAAGAAKGIVINPGAFTHTSIGVHDAIKAVGASATLVPLDLKDVEGIDRLGHALRERFGRLDVMVGNAALLGPLSPLGHVEAKAWQEVIAVNVTANWRLICAMAALLLSAPSALAVKIGDITHLQGTRTNRLEGMGLVVGLPGTGDGGRYGKLAICRAAPVSSRMCMPVFARSTM